jgi:hypothetical protein
LSSSWDLPCLIMLRQRRMSVDVKFMASFIISTPTERHGIFLIERLFWVGGSC